MLNGTAFPSTELIKMDVKSSRQLRALNLLLESLKTSESLMIDRKTRLDTLNLLSDNKVQLRIMQFEKEFMVPNSSILFHSINYTRV